MTLAAIALTAALASPIDREAGPPHTPIDPPEVARIAEQLADALSPSELAMLFGLQPVIEAEDTRICPAAWHVREDWHTWCAWTLAESPKVPQERAGWPVAGIAPARPYAPLWWGYGHGGGTGAAPQGFPWYGGGWSDGDTYVEGDTIVKRVRHGDHYDCEGCPCPEKPEPPAVPLPGSVWTMLAAVATLMRRLK